MNEPTLADFRWWLHDIGEMDDYMLGLLDDFEAYWEMTMMPGTGDIVNTVWGTEATLVADIVEEEGVIIIDDPVYGMVEASPWQLKQYAEAE
jgi:hypothetical protein